MREHGAWSLWERSRSDLGRLCLEVKLCQSMDADFPRRLRRRGSGPSGRAGDALLAGMTRACLAATTPPRRRRVIRHGNSIQANARCSTHEGQYSVHSTERLTHGILHSFETVSGPLRQELPGDTRGCGAVLSCNFASCTGLLAKGITPIWNWHVKFADTHCRGAIALRTLMVTCHRSTSVR